MNKNEILDYLSKKDIWFEVTEHQAVYNMEETFRGCVAIPRS